jgi:murein DD-endopeptidase MepM/ murein hydrolase activator NlpD
MKWFALGAIGLQACAGLGAKPQAATQPITLVEPAVMTAAPPEMHASASHAPATPETPPVVGLCDPQNPSAAPCMTLTPAEPRPGDLLMIEVLAPEANAVSVDVFDATVPLYRAGQVFRGFTAVPLKALPEAHPTLVTIDNDNGESAFSCAEADVTAREFPYEELKVPRRFARHKTVDASAQSGEEVSSMVKPQEAPMHSASLFLWPKLGSVRAVFGERRLFNHKVASRHLGTDIEGKVGERIFASQEGVVRFSARNKASGEVVVIDHGGGLLTHYLHMSKRLVKVGEKVMQGELIGYVGRTGRVTGPHLHFAVSVHGRYVDPEQVLAHPMFADAAASPCHPAQALSASAR